MNHKWTMSKTARLLSLLVLVGLLAPAALVGATPPISGQTIEFDSSSAVSGNTAQMRAIIAVDLDQDGDLDLVTGRDSYTNEVRAWQNNGAPFDGAWSTYGAQIGDTGTATSALAAADLDHDGYVDLVAGGTDNNVYIFKGNSTPFTGPWATSRDISASSAGDVNGLAVADVDRDGNPDIISVHTSSSGNEVSVWENPYDRSTNPDIFDEDWTAHNLSNSTNKTANAVDVADVDRDGYVDLVVGYNGTTGAEVVVWENTYDASAWTFTQRDVDSSSGTVNSVAVGDFDQDGYVDVVQGSIDDEVVLWENTYDTTAWTFSEHTIASGLGDDVERVAVADFDNDGAPDVAVGMSTGATNEVLVYGNDADATFDWSFTRNDVGVTSTNIMGLATGDLDSDGDADLATARANTTVGGEYEVAAWENDLPHRNPPFDSNGNGGGDSATVNSVALGDLDGDGDLDSVSASGSTIIAWQNDGTPFTETWPLNTVTSRSSTVNSVALGDLDGDGDLDIVSGSSAAEVYEIMAWENDGSPFSGTWTQRNVGASTDFVNAVAVGDLDNDGDLDVVCGTSNAENYEVIAWQNDGMPFDGTWSQNDVGSSTDAVWMVVLGDLDDDGNLDIVSGSGYGEDYEVIAWQNDGSPFTGTWPQNDVGSDSPDGAIHAVALGDLDNDGDLDIVSGQKQSAAPTGNINVWENDGTPFSGLWARNRVGEPADDTFGVAVGDIDRDADLDIVSGAGTSSEDYEVIAWENDGTPFSGTWTQDDIGASSGDVYSVALGDLDRDGDLDVLSGSTSTVDDEVIAWQNQGGSAGLAVSDTSPANIGNGVEDDLFKVVFAHNGISADRTLELNQWDLDILHSDCTTPMTTTAANNIIDTLYVRLDDGDDVFETSDTAVATVTDLNLLGGVQAVAFTDGDANVQVSATGSKTYWISVLTTSDASSQSPSDFCLNFDPDADALVEGKTPDFSVSQQDTEPTDTGAVVPTAVTLASFTATAADADGGAILLQWETATELDNLGFHLYRADSTSSPRTRLNADLIPSQNPGSPIGARYEFVDESVEPGAMYYYWLGSVDVYGAAALHGPVPAVTAARTTSYIYLPTVRK